MIRTIRLIAVLALSAAFVACGGSGSGPGSFQSPTDPPGTSGSGGGAAAVASLTVTSSTPTIPNDGSASATITALALDANHNLVPNVTVAFTATSGGIAVTNAVTNASGAAIATLSTAGNAALRTITVTAGVGNQIASVNVNVVQASGSGTSSTEQMGNGSGTSFVPSVIAVGQSTLSAGGTTGLQVSIVDQNGLLYTASPVTVTFNSQCVAQQLASITATAGDALNPPVAGQAVTSTGIVSATYTASGCSGADTITASATVNSQSLQATGTVTVGAATIGSIQFVSATPTSIGLKGTGLQETSTVIFKVLDSTGGPRPNATVNFTLNTSIGGLSVSPASATSAADGTVQTTVSSGTVHTTVRVTASIANPALQTQSSQLTVTTGLPASAAFSIAVGQAKYGAGVSVTAACPNMETWSIDGVTAPITVQLADRYNNPAPDGTAVAFTTLGGHIVGSCTTPLATPGDGTCSVTWTSANPRPVTTDDTPPLVADGRSMILATAIGEESFTDVSGSGYYQSGDPFANLGEPYRDDNENGQYDLGEYYLDFNQNGVWDKPDGTFHGIVCTDNPAPAPGQPCTTLKTNTWAISAPLLLVMSTSAANPTPTVSGTTYPEAVLAVTGFTGTPPLTAGTPLTITHGTPGSILFNIQDLHGNPMAAGTKVAITADSAIGSISSTGSSFTIPCSTTFGGNNFITYFTPVATLPAAPAPAPSGNIYIQVTSPNGLITTITIPVNVD